MKSKTLFAQGYCVEIFTKLFSTSDFPARWNCGQWTSVHGWLHILSDLGIWSAYFAIPAVLGYFLAKRNDLPFRSVFALFAVFILLCGTTHLMDAIIFWWPAYRLSGTIKFATAIVSWTTVLALIQVVPGILSMRSPEALSAEIEARKRAEAELLSSNSMLEKRVQERTEQLVMANRRLDVTLRSISQGFFAVDNEWQFTFLNAQAESIFTKPRDEMTGKQLWDVFPEMVGTSFDRELKRAMHDRVHLQFEYEFARGTWLNLNVFPIEDGGLSLYMEDVTERKVAELRLKESEARFRQIADTMPQFVWVTRPDGFHEYYNQRWYDFIGRTQEECEGDGWNAPLHPDDRERSMERWNRSLQTGEPYEIEYRFRSKSGEYRWFLGRALPVKDFDGSIVRWFGTCTDIEEFKRVDAERQKFVSLAENSSDFIGIFDLEGTPSYINRAGLSQVGFASLDDAKLVPAKEFFFPEDQPRILSDFLPSVLERGQGNIEIRFRHFRTGNAIWMLYSAFPLTDGNGHHTGLATVSRNISERRQLEDNLRQLAADLSETNRRKDEFLATLAHELRNPLAPLRNGLQILKLVGSEGQTIETARSMMERQLAQMVRLVDDLLDVSRITRGKVELKRERLDLRSIIHSALETAQPWIESQQHKLTVSMPEHPVCIDADPTRLAQVFSNLLNNASKYTSEGGSIELEVATRNDEVLIDVKDNGMGIPPAMLPKVFDLFTQVDRTLERSRGGLGIGLTLVQRLVELHGGTVTASSDGYGKGSKFSVTLPCVVQNQPRESMTQASPHSVLTRRRVLVVDDNEDAAKSLAMLLGIMGNDVKVVHDGLHAVNEAAKFSPDIILMDIGMPRMNGYEACQAIRKLPNGNKPVIVACTGWGQEEDRQRSRDSGFNFHLVKPVDPNSLEKLLANLSDSDVH